MKNIFQKALTVTGMVVAAQVSYAQAWDPNLNTTDHTGRIGSVSVGTPLSVAGVKFLVSVDGSNIGTSGTIGIVSDGTFGLVPSIPNTRTRWSALGDRTPISLVPGFQTTGLRTQWENYGLNVGIVNRQASNATGGKDALIAWQDATFPGDPTTISPFSTLAGLRFVFRNGLVPSVTGTALEVMRMLPNGNIGIGISTPVAKLQVENGIIGQSSIPNTFGFPSGRWSAIGTFGGPSTTTGFVKSVSGFSHTWSNRAFYAGLFESAGQRDGLIAWQDFSRTSAASNRLRIGSIIGTGSGANFTEHATVLSNGNFGIGTSTPSARLSVEGTAAITANSTNVLSITGAGNNVSNYIFVNGSQNDGAPDRRGLNINFVRTGTSASAEYGVESRVQNFNSGSTGLYCGVAGIARYGLNSPAPGPGNSTYYGVFGQVGGSRTAINTTNGTGSTYYAIFGTTDNGSNNWAGYFQGSVYATVSVTASDQKLKENVKNMDANEEAMANLMPKTYTFKKDMQETMVLPKESQMGFIAQDVEKYFPQLVYPVVQPEKRDSSGNVIAQRIAFKGINYQGLIPVLWATMQKQQKTITQMQKEMEKLQTKKDLAQRQGLAMDSSDTNELYQNTPNPFSQNTVIAYKIVSTATKASIQIFDMTGKTIKKYEVLPSSTQITLEANGLTLGMYMYALVVDGKLVDTKRMILE